MTEQIVDGFKDFYDQVYGDPVQGAGDTPEVTDPGNNNINRFQFKSAEDLLAAPKPVSWLIKDILDENALAQVFGDPGTMKSFVAIDVGLCIATGRDWHGYSVRKHGPVFYIAGEGHAGISRRLRAWEIAHEASIKGVPFFVSDRPAQFLDERSAEEVVAAVDELIESYGTPVLVIIDTLNRNFGPGNESDTADMTSFISCVDDKLRCRYRCTVMIVHHTGLKEKSRARGSMALTAALDWEYRLSQGANEIRLLTNTKVKDHEPPLPISFRPEIIELEGWSDPDDGKVMTSCVLHRVDRPGRDQRKPLAGAKKVAFDALIAAIEQYGILDNCDEGQDHGKTVHVDRWREIAYAAGISSSTNQNSKKKAFQRAVNELRDGGWVDTWDDYWWPKRDEGQERDIVWTCQRTS